jgi:hypothetical protein
MNQTEKKCNCGNDTKKDNINYILLGGILVIIYLIYTKKC